jgi:hypothetical protein
MEGIPSGAVVTDWRREVPRGRCSSGLCVIRMIKPSLEPRHNHLDAHLYLMLQRHTVCQMVDLTINPNPMFSHERAKRSDCNAHAVHVLANRAGSLHRRYLSGNRVQLIRRQRNECSIFKLHQAFFQRFLCSSPIWSCT